MQFAIGIVAVVAFFALAAMIIWFGELQTVFKDRRTYYVYFKSAPGVEAKAPVRRAGIRVGEITRVEFSETDALVIVTIVLEGKNQLREGDYPRLRTSLLGGDVVLDIETEERFRGKPDRKVIPPGTTLEGKSPFDLDPTAEAASSLVPNANKTIEELGRTSQQWTQVGERANKLLAQNEEEVNRILAKTRETMERLNSTLESFNNVLDPKTQQDVKKTIANLAKSSDDLAPLIESSRKTIDQISGTTRKLEEVADNLTAATKPLADRSESTIRNLDETARSLNLATADVAEMLKRFRTTDGSLKRLIEDPKLYQHLDDAALKLDASLSELQTVMKDLTVFSDKIARHPGELGVQGVLTRDQGTKSVPPSKLRPD
jgi:phospholipid/cholesterol/gamma-HCH transport system substrate-binding protein